MIVEAGDAHDVCNLVPRRVRFHRPVLFAGERLRFPTHQIRMSGAGMQKRCERFGPKEPAASIKGVVDR